MSVMKNIREDLRWQGIVIRHVLMGQREIREGTRLPRMEIRKRILREAPNDHVRDAMRKRWYG